MPDSSESKAKPRYTSMDCLPDGILCHALTYLNGKDLCRATVARRLPTMLEAHWRAHWRLGDRLDARDVQECWYPAQIIGLTADLVLVHYDAWGTSFDEWFSRKSPSLRPLYAKTVDWRARLVKGQLIEMKDERDRWHIAQIQALEVGDSPWAWRRLRLFPIGITLAHRGTADAYYRTIPPTELPMLEVGYDSDRIAPLRTHVRYRLPIYMPIDTLINLVQFSSDLNFKPHQM